MNVQVRYFASLREALGAGESVEVAAGTTLAGLRDLLLVRSPRHADVLSRGRLLRCALDQRLCDEDVPIEADAEVAFFPPVTGG
jgi:molybdopterin synthase sulfur carrier subunit